MDHILNLANKSDLNALLSKALLFTCLARRWMGHWEMPCATMAFDPKMQSIEDGIANIDFHHPFTPYDVQEQFMKTVYQVLESGNGQIGILESPTGTVSTISQEREHSSQNQRLFEHKCAT